MARTFLSASRGIDCNVCAAWNFTPTNLNGCDDIRPLRRLKTPVHNKHVHTNHRPVLDTGPVINQPEVNQPIVRSYTANPVRSQIAYPGS